MDLRDLVLGHPREVSEGVYRITWGDKEEEGFELDHGTLVQLAGCLEIEMAQVAYWTKYAANLDHAALLGLCTKLYLALMDQRSRMQTLQSQKARSMRSRSPPLRQREVVTGAPPPPLPTLGRKDGQPTPPMSARTDSSRERHMPDVFTRLSRPPSVDPQVIRGIEERVVEREGPKASDKLKQVIDGHNSHDDGSQPPHPADDRPKSSGEVFNRLYNAGKEQKVRRRVNEEIVGIEAQARLDAQREEAQRLHPRGTPRDGITTSLRLFDEAKQRADESARKQQELDDAARRDSNSVASKESKSGARDRSTSSKRLAVGERQGRVHERLYRCHNEQRKRLEELSNKHIATTCPFRPNLSGKVQRSSSATNLNSVSRSSSAPRAAPHIPVVAPPTEAREKPVDESFHSSTPTTQQVIETLGSARRAAHDLLDSLGAIEVPVAEEMLRKEQIGIVGSFAPPPRSGLRY
jgi:hypothetical protein